MLECAKSFKEHLQLADKNIAKHEYPRTMFLYVFNRKATAHKRTTSTCLIYRFFYYLTKKPVHLNRDSSQKIGLRKNISTTIWFQKLSTDIKFIKERRPTSVRVKNKTVPLKVDNLKRKQGRVNKIWTRKNSLAANLFRVDKAITIFQNATK